MGYAGKIKKTKKLKIKKYIKNHFQKKTIAKIGSLSVHRKDVRKQNIKKILFLKKNFSQKAIPRIVSMGVHRRDIKKLNSETKKLHFPSYIIPQKTLP